MWVWEHSHTLKEKRNLAKQNISVCIADCKTYKLNEKSQMLLYAIRRLEGTGVSKVLSPPPSSSIFHLVSPKTWNYLKAFRPHAHESACVRVSGRENTNY